MAEVIKSIVGIGSILKEIYRWAKEKESEKHKLSE